MINIVSICRNWGAIFQIYDLLRVSVMSQSNTAYFPWRCILSALIFMGDFLPTEI